MPNLKKLDELPRTGTDREYLEMISSEYVPAGRAVPQLPGEDYKAYWERLVNLGWHPAHLQPQKMWLRKDEVEEKAASP